MARYKSQIPTIQPVRSNKPELLSSLAQRMFAFAEKSADELDREVAKKGKEQGLIDAQGKTEITLRDGKTIADEAWNEGAIASHAAAVKLDIADNVTRIATENPNPEDFSSAATAYGSGMLEGVPEELQPLVKDELASTILKGRMNAEQNLRSLQLQERRVQTGDALDLLKSQALDATDNMLYDDAAKYQGQAEDMINALVADSTITPAEGAKYKQEIQDDVDKQTVIGKFKDALEMDKDEEFLKRFSGKKMGAFFSPDKREKILAEMLSIRSRRNSIEALNRKEGLKEINKYVEARANGFTPSKKDTIRVTQLAENAGLTEDFNQKIDDIEVVNAYSKAPVTLRHAKIAELGQGGEIDDYNKWKALKEADARIAKKAQDDGYALGVKQGVITMSPLDYKEPITFEERTRQAKFLSSHYGVEVSPFTDAEVANLVEQTKVMTPAELTDLASSIGGMGNTKALQEIAKKQAPVFAMMAAIEQPQVSETVFFGQRELDLGNVKLPAGDDKKLMESDLYNYMGNVYTGEDLQAIRQSVNAHYAGVHGNNEYDSDIYEQSMKAVTGGVAKMNGYSIELPRGVEDSVMENFIDGFSVESVISIGGVDNRTPVDAAKMIREGIWRSRPGGVYAVITPFGEMMQNGKPLRIEYDPALTGRKPLTFEEFQAKVR